MSNFTALTSDVENTEAEKKNNASDYSYKE